MKIFLTVVGASFEFTGIVLVASPELFPRAGAVIRFVRARMSQWWHRLLLRLGRHGRHVFDKGTAGGVGHASAGAVGFKMVGEDAPLDQQLAFLREFVEKTENRLGELEGRVTDLPRQWQHDIREAREAIDSMVTKRIEQIRDTHIRVRLVGIGFLLAGVPILATANVI